MQRTLVILKPDAVQKKKIGDCIKAFEENGLKVIALKMQEVGRGVWESHYEHHAGKPFFEDTVSFMAAGPVVIMIVEGENAVDDVRKIVGATNPKEADADSLRAKFANSIGRNLIHASDSVETAESEIKRFFNNDEIFVWEENPLVLQDRD